MRPPGELISVFIERSGFSLKVLARLARYRHLELLFTERGREGGREEGRRGKRKGREGERKGEGVDGKGGRERWREMGKKERKGEGGREGKMEREGGRRRGRELVYYRD